MKRIASFVALILFSAMSFAAVSITVSPNNVDFGEVSIKGKTSVEGSTTINVTYSGLQAYCGVVFEDDVMPDDGAAFWLDGTNVDGWIYGGDQYNPAEGNGLTLHYYADAAGTYTGKIRFFSYTDSDWEVKSDYVYLTIKLTVTDEAIVPKTIPFERVTSLTDGDTIIFVSEAAGAVSAPLKDTYLQVLTDGVTIDATSHKAEVPETGVQMFRASKYSGNWQFYTLDATPKRLHLDASGKGAFTYAATSETIFATWAVSFSSSGAATVCRPSDDGFPVEFNSDRFKPYKTPQGSTYQIYKKVGKAAEITSKLEIGAIDFGTVELDEVKEVVVNYTGENLTADIEWDFTGTDAALFSVTPTSSTNRTSGSVTVKYLGTAAAVKTINAKLYALTQDAKLDDLEKEIPISITLAASTIKLTKIEFVGAPDSLVKGKSIDLKPYLVFTPSNAADKSLTWTVDKSYQGSVADGVYTAKNVTGEVTITATSVKVPSVSASVTLMQYEPKPKSITLDKHEITTYIGNVDTLVATVGPEGANQACYFESRNKDVLTCSIKNGKGLLTIKALCPDGIWVVVNPGAKGENQTILDSCLVKVIPVTVESVAFDPDSKEMSVGATYQLVPVVTPAAAATQYTATYESNNTAVATVSETGLVTAKAEGTAKITCTLGGKSGQITINVVGAKYFTKVTDATTLGLNDTIILATKITLSEVLTPIAGGEPNSSGNLEIIQSGVTISDDAAACETALTLVVGGAENAYTLTKLGSTSKLIAKDDKKVGYGSSNTTWMFDTDGNGVIVRNVAYNTKCISYSSQSGYIRQYATGANVTPLYVYVRKYAAPVLPDPTAVELDQTSYDTHVGDPDVTLKATVKPSGASQEVIWESSNTDVATVNANGKVHPKTVGQAIITAKAKADETIKATCTVNVIAWTVEYVEFDIAGDLNLEVGEQETVTATAYPTGHGFKVDYYTSNENIATVTIGGVVTGVAAGDAVITAKSGDKEAKLNVHVVAAPVPEDKGEISIAGFLAAKDEFNIYTLTGWVTNIKEDSDGVPYKKGEFTLNDATGSIAIYGILTPAGVADKFWEMDIEEKDTVTLKGSYDEYKGTPQIKNATLVEVKKYVEPVDPTAIDAVRANKQATKVLREGQIIIIREEKEFDVVGRRVK